MTTKTSTDLLNVWQRFSVTCEHKAASTYSSFCKPMSTALNAVSLYAVYLRAFRKRRTLLREQQSLRAKQSGDWAVIDYGNEAQP